MKSFFSKCFATHSMRFASKVFFFIQQTAAHYTNQNNFFLILNGSSELLPLCHIKWIDGRFSAIPDRNLHFQSEQINLIWLWILSEYVHFAKQLKFFVYLWKSFKCEWTLKTFRFHLLLPNTEISLLFELKVRWESKTKVFESRTSKHVIYAEHFKNAHDTCEVLLKMGRKKLDRKELESTFQYFLISFV